LALLLVLAPAPAQTLPPIEGPGDPFFGVNFVDPVEPWTTLAWDAGVRTVRTQLSWRDVELEPGVWTWDEMDGRIDPLVARGFEILGILTLPAPWAQEHPDEGLVPRNLNLPWNHPENYWGRYVYNTVLHYRGRIQHYEVWNEPDMAMYWEGDAAQYYQLLRLAYRAIQAADPDATVLMAGMELGQDPDFFRVVVRLAAEDPTGPNFDAVSIHSYTNAEWVYERTRDARALLDGYGFVNVPIWITETNIPLWGEGAAPSIPSTGYATPEEAAWYIIQAFANARAAGAGRMMVFRLADERIPIPYGLVRNSGEPRPSYEAFHTAAAFLSDVVGATRDLTEDAVIVRCVHADGSHVTVMWASGGAPASVTIAAQVQIGVFADAAGNTWLAQPQDGAYTITLNPATNYNQHQTHLYLVGGPPIILLEGDFSPPTTTVEISRTDVGMILVRWHGDDGPIGTGVAAYDVEVRHNDGEWIPWLTGTADTEAPYDVSAGGSYAFRARAADFAGNVGEFSEQPQAEIDLGGVLVAQVLNVRGEGVQSARVYLADGTMYDTDIGGWVRIENLPVGEVAIQRVDGSAQGVLDSPPPVEVTLSGEALATWILHPVDDLIPNGDFEIGAGGWSFPSTSQGDVAIVRSEDNAVLQITGGRRPWGSPTASVTLEVPPDMVYGTLVFRYRLLQDGPVLRVRVAGPEGQTVLWQTDTSTPEWASMWLDMSVFAGQTITLTFELWSPKGAPEGTAQLDDVMLGSVPPLDQQ
jgi:hypothetical protein